MNDLKPLKRFGQNYLKDRNILNKIINEINPQKDDSIIEIGPGTGVLTSKLVEKTDNLLAVEIDKRVSDYLREKFPSIKLITNDFMNISLPDIYSSYNKRLRIAGNIPYNLTSPILFKLMDNYKIISDAVFMVQYEVAKRITAKSGTKDYGILSVLLSYFSDVKLCFKVSPNVFYPKPKVFSAVIHVLFKQEINEEIINVFINVVKSSFGNRRKTLKNSLSNSIFGNIDFKNSEVDLSLRPEQLELHDFIKLAEFARKNMEHAESQT